MGKKQNIVSLLLKSLAIGLSIVSIVLGFFPDVGDANTHITLLGIGLAALAATSLMNGE